MHHAVGPLCSVDLTAGEAAEENIDDVLEQFIGGRGVATKLAHDRIPFDADPLGPENRVYVSTGPLQYSETSFTGRANMTGVSPLTGGLASTNAGGYVSRNVAATGYSAVELVGASDELVIVHVTDEGVEFEPVPELAGARVSDVSAYLEDEHGLGAEHTIAIGPAGENLVRFACPMTSDSRAFGRGGLGAAMGAKNVKAITFDGDSHPELDLDAEVEAEIHQEAATSDDIMKRQGTTSGTEWINDNFSLPTRYFSELSFEGVEHIGGDAVEEKKYERGTCSVCAFACKLPTRDEERGVETEGPEFETVMAFGSNCGVDDVVDVMQSNDLCDELGMDTISCGDTVAAYLASEDAFGDADLVHETVEKIAHREGIGDTLAEGIDRCHDDLGVENWSVKGLEFAAHDGRVLHGLALSYAVANRGADHMYATVHGREYRGEIPAEGTDGKAEYVIEDENFAAFRDSGVVCAFAGDYIDDEDYEALFDADYDDLMAVGARIVELERHFNNQRGFDREDDTLPYAEAIDGLEDAIQEYYELRGWNPDGTVPDGNINRTDATAD